MSNTLTQIAYSYFNLVTKRPILVLSVVFAVLLIMLAGLPNFKLDASADSLTLENDTDLEFFRKTSKRYASGDFLFVTFTPKKDLFSDESLELLQELQADLATVTGVTRVNSILNVPLLYSPKLSLIDLARGPRTLLLKGVDRSAARQEFWNSPIYKNLVLGPDGQTTALQISLELDERAIALVRERDDLAQKKREGGLDASELARYEIVKKEYRAHRTEADARAHKRVEEVRAIIEKYKPQAQVFVGGISMITADMIAFIKSDLIVFGVAVLAFMILVLFIIFRSAVFVFIPMISCLSAVGIMLGLVSWLDWRLTVISSNFVALLLIISLSIIIHLVVRYREYEQQYPDWKREKLVIATMKFMAKPCLYTAVTTIVAFASLVVSDIRPVIDFGWMMTMGLVVALVLAFLILPSALVLIPNKNKLKPTESQAENKTSKPMTLLFSALVERYGSIVLIGFVVVFLLSIFGVSKLTVENRFVDYFHDDTEIHQGLKVIDNNLGGTISFDILLSAPELDVLNDGDAESDDFEDDFDSGFDTGFDDEPFDELQPKSPSNPNGYWMTVAGLKRIQWLHDYLESLPEVGKVQSLATLYKVGQDINGSLSDFELAVMQRALSGAVRNVLISPYLSPDGEQARVTMRVIDTYPGLKRAELMQRIKTHVEREAPFALENVRYSGLLVLYNNMLQSLYSSQILTLAVVFVAIFLMLAIVFKSPYVAAVAIVPNIVAAVSVLGVMGLLNIPLDMMTITIAAITVGIGVDDTIHYIHRFKTELKIDGDYVAAMHRAHASIGRAMFYTTVIIVFGFGIMVLSEFIPTIYFGVLTGVAMFAALIGALLMLPKLILLAKPFKF